MKKLLALCALCCGMAMAQTAAPGRQEAATLYNYHTAPPFVTTEGQGFVHALGDYLSARLPGSSLRLETVPRKRLDLAMGEAGFRGAVLLVSPLWFGDADMKTHLWTRPLFTDEDVIVSRAAQKLDYQAPDSLKGRSVGIVRGYQYPMFDSLVASGAITRIDTSNETSALTMVERGRLDSIVIARSALGFLSHALQLEQPLFVASVPVNRYERRILVGRANPALKQALDGVIEKMPQDPQWRGILKKYGLAELR